MYPWGTNKGTFTPGWQTLLYDVLKLKTQEVHLPEPLTVLVSHKNLTSCDQIQARGEREALHSDLQKSRQTGAFRKQDAILATFLLCYQKIFFFHYNSRRFLQMLRELFVKFLHFLSLVCIFSDMKLPFSLTKIVYFAQRTITQQCFKT